MTFRFNSLADFSKALKVMPHHYVQEDEKWTGETLTQSLERCAKGWTDKVAEAEKLLSKVEASIETKQVEWVNDMAGAFPSVPDYLAGHPDCMRRMTDSTSESAPIRIYVCTTSSCGMKWKHLQQRGISILAATMALSQRRPVELWVCTSLHGRDGTSNIMVRINAAPLNLSEACYALCSMGFDRHLTHGYARWLNGFNGSWSKYGWDEEGLRKMLKAEPTDLVVKPSFLTDEQIIADPVGWVKDVLAKYIKDSEEVYA